MVGTFADDPPWLLGDPMKCQKCDKPATFHITELTGGTPEELHLCEDCAHQFLSAGGSPNTGMGNLAGALAQQLAVTSTAEQLAELDQQVCPMCGISFYEFREGGHGESGHAGKEPKLGPLDSSEQTSLIKLRKDMQEAVTREEYERASQLRDQMRTIQQAARSERPRD